MRAQADLIVGLLDYLKIDEAAVCGNSIGGDVALHVVRRCPARVNALILVDSTGMKPDKDEPAAPSFTRWSLIGPVLTALALSTDSMVRDGVRRCYYDKSKTSQECVAASYQVLKTRAGLKAALATQAQAEVDLTEPMLSNIKKPTLILWGRQDELVPLAAGQKFNALIPRSRLVVVERCGHVPQLEMPERFAREVSEFLASVVP
jgi:pimeloyl-ACP methyl ester carboxylesterase